MRWLTSLRYWSYKLSNVNNTINSMILKILITLYDNDEIFELYNNIVKNHCKPYDLVNSLIHWWHWKLLSFLEEVDLFRNTTLPDQGQSFIFLDKLKNLFDLKVFIQKCFVITFILMDACYFLWWTLWFYLCQQSSRKKDSTTSESSDSSSDAEEEKVSKRKPPVLVLGKKAETDSDSSSEDERSGKPVVQSPVKRKVRDKSSDSDSSSSSSNIKTGTNLNISPKKPVSSRKNVAKVKNVKKESSSSDSDSSSDEEPKTTGRQTGPSLKKAPVNKKSESSSGSSSSEDEANKTQKKHQARSSPTKKVMLNNKVSRIDMYICK